LERTRRIDLEEEIAHRGSGHENEVEMRLKFESKLNQMYAKLRETETKMTRVSKKLRNRTVTLDDAVRDKNKAIDAAKLLKTDL
jgi:hypothetical protein